MKLIDIYAVIKQGPATNFYHPDRLNVADFIYIHDASLTLRRIDKETIFGRDHFFDENDEEIALTDNYDKLVKEVCKVKDFPETYNNINRETWAIELNGVAVYWIDVLSIVNPSSLWVYLPLSLNPYDFEVNLCDILNDTFRGSLSQIEQTIRNSLNIKSSTFQDFIRR